MFKKLVVCGLIASLLSMPGIALAKSAPIKPHAGGSRPAHHQTIKHSTPHVKHHVKPIVKHKAPVRHVVHHSHPHYEHYHSRPYRSHHHGHHSHSLHSGDYAVIAAGVILGAILANS